MPSSLSCRGSLSWEAGVLVFVVALAPATVVTSLGTSVGETITQRTESTLPTRPVLGSRSSAALSVAAITGRINKLFRRGSEVESIRGTLLNFSNEGHQAHFFRDVRGNTVQLSSSEAGRLRVTLANGSNESLGLSVRGADGKPRMPQLTQVLEPTAEPAARSVSRIAFDLEFPDSEVQIGHILLDGVLTEREVRARGVSASAFDSGEVELLDTEILHSMVDTLEALPPAEQQRQLELLNAYSLSDLQSRIGTDFVVFDDQSARLTRASIDGKRLLALDIETLGSTRLKRTGRALMVHSESEKPSLRFTLRTNGAPALRPLQRDELFAPTFLDFLSDGKRGAEDRARTELLTKSFELLSTDDKFLAGLPNYGTYFGRDTLMSALLLEQILTPEALEHAISSVLRRLTDDGRAVHEEILGRQAYRENLVDYVNALQSNDYEQARSLAQNLYRHRSTWKLMADDDFILMALLGRYFERPDVGAAQKRAFLQRNDHLDLVLRNLEFIEKEVTPYAESGRWQDLIAFQETDGHYYPHSWRDSEPGYAGGKFPMDVNVVWVPAALEAARTVSHEIDGLGLTPPAGRSLPDAERFQRLLEAWQGTDRHFWVTRSADRTARSIDEKLRSLPSLKQGLWTNASADAAEIRFLAVSVADDGQPLAVMNSDMSSLLLTQDLPAEEAAAIAETLTQPYPRGLLIDDVGLLATNDIHEPSAWKAFEKDPYHGPKVVWGREVAQFQIAALRNFLRLFDSKGKLIDPATAPHAQKLYDAAKRVRDAAIRSGLVQNEVWSYTKDSATGKAKAVRYGSRTEDTSDIQLWNAMFLMSEYLFDQARPLGEKL